MQNCLNLKFQYAILFLSCGETGANPVRARRRKVQKCCFSCSVPQTEDIPLDFSEKVKNSVPQSEYPQDKSL